METKKESLKVKNKISPDGKITDFIQCESVGGTIEIHRGRNGYEWTGQKGKTLEWTIPVRVEKSADEILTKIYNCEEWQQTGKGKETSIDSPALREIIWNYILPHIDMKAMHTVPVSGTSHDSMNRTLIKGKYVVETKRDITTYGANECYTFYQTVEKVTKWFLDNISKDYFKDKVLYLNADDTKSAFWLYFYNNFKRLGLKELIATHYDGSGLSCGNSETNIKQIGFWEEYAGYILKYDGEKIKRIPPDKVKSNFHGDYKEKICMDIARNEADIIMTNPPFGKEWEQYVKCMMDTGKKLIFWGNGNVVHYNWFMPFLNEHKIYVVKDVSDIFETNYYMSPNYWRKKICGYVYTTEDLSKICTPSKDHYLTKEKMLKDGTAWYAKTDTMLKSTWKTTYKDLDKILRQYHGDDIKVLCCDNAMIPTNTDEVLAVSIAIIKHGILNAGYEIVDYGNHNIMKNDKRGFVRILIRKKKK